MSDIIRQIAEAFLVASASDIGDGEASEKGAFLIRELIRKNWDKVSSSVGGPGTFVSLNFSGGWEVYAWIRDDGRLTDGHITVGGGGGTFGFFGRTRIEKVHALWGECPRPGEQSVVLPEAPPAEGEVISGWKSVSAIGSGQFRAEFRAGRDGCPLARVKNKVAFPEKKGPQPHVDEVWVVEIAGENPRQTVFFLKLVKKIR